MPKIKPDPIVGEDLIDYLDTSSDFAFELRCLQALTGLGFSCQHGGSYTDQVTKKDRQFDIRARMNDRDVQIACAVECKNLSPSYPLLVMCVPRTKDEAFHEVLRSGGHRPTYPDPLRAKSRGVRVNSLVYKCGLSVGKSCSRVGRTSDGFVGSDGDIFERWSQALASARDLADGVAITGNRSVSDVLALLVPVLVVPDGTLWHVDYQADGKMLEQPRRVDRCSYFIGRRYGVGDGVIFAPFTFSHLEFVTLTGLDMLGQGFLRSAEGWLSFDPESKVQEA
jgi:hypothetical protein